MNIVWKLFITFLKIGLLSIGGGYAIIPLIQEQAVEKNGWITEKIFTDIITISQMIPDYLFHRTYYSYFRRGYTASAVFLLSIFVNIYRKAVCGAGCRSPPANLDF